MGVGADIIGIFKTNTKVFFKETIEKLKNNCLGGSYLMFRSNPMVPIGRPVVPIGYKYNTRNFLSFIVP